MPQERPRQELRNESPLDISVGKQAFLCVLAKTRFLQKSKNSISNVKNSILGSQFKELTKGTFVPGTSSFFEELNWN